MNKPLPKPEGRTRKGNGSVIMANVDGRTMQARRFKELLAELSADLGGDLTQAQQAIAARAATLITWCEGAETDFALGKPFDVATYSTTANAMRRLLADLGLERRAKDVTPSLQSYLHGKAAAVA